MTLAISRNEVQIVAYIRIVRIENVIITGLSVFVAGWISSATWVRFSTSLWMAALSAALIAAGGNAFNDYCDRDLDRIQKPNRPIPSGQISPTGALWCAGICFLTGLLLALPLGGTALLIASWAIIMLMFYSYRWKRQPLVGNLIVAFVAALAFVYGGVAVRSTGIALWAAALAFLFHLGREIVKDLEDQWGDAAGRAQTMVVRFGQHTGVRVANGVFLLLILFLPIPYWIGPFGAGYIRIALAAVLPVLILSMIWLWRKPEQLHKLSVILKWDMLIGLAALLIGRPTSP